MSDLFYRAFEDKHRGSRELIKARLTAYLPFVEPLLKIYPQAQAIDLGCGRGEWLELLGESGFSACGVDLDAGMLEACKPLNLKTELMDALTALKQLPDHSQAVVSGFHLAEHIPFETLLSLVQEAQRVLVPAGLLILETPNPDNLIVGTSSFYLDPTHVKPIPPLLLTFIPEFVGGYSKIKTIGLQEPDCTQTQSLALLDVFRGVSPDYALIAQKQASKDIEEVVSHAFFVERGITLSSISGQYDEHINLKIENLEKLSLQGIQRAGEAIQKAEEASIGAQQAQDEAVKATSAAQQAQDEAVKATSAAHQAQNALAAIYASTSWRITSPVRWVGQQRRLLKEQGVLVRFKKLVKKILRVFVSPSVLVAPAAFVSPTDDIKHQNDQSYLAIGPNSEQAKTALKALVVEMQKKQSKSN